MGAAPNSKTFDSVLETIRNESKNTVELGEKFEKITRDFLVTDTKYKRRFRGVYLWKDWKYKASVSPHGGDIGVDLVAEEADGSLCAIQCKCYADDGTLDYKILSTFFSTSDLIRKELDRKVNTILVYTGDRTTPNADSAIRINRCHVIGQNEFRNSTIVWENFPRLRVRKPRTLYPHQERAFKDVMERLETADRGKLIMACGTGKTMTALKIAEKYAGVGKTVLYLVPSISLVNQTMSEWSENAGIDHHYAVVCSDKTVGDGEDGDISLLAFPPTTDVNDLKESFSTRKKDAMGVVFSTYHSIDVAKKAVSEFDIVFCDEAHRTASAEKEDGDASYFAKVHDNSDVRAKKRVYMTATPRVYGEAVKNKVNAYSMDEPDIYGEEFHNYSFDDAVKDKTLSDFKVRIPVIPEDDLATYTNESIDGQDGTIDERVLLAAVWHGLNYNDDEKRPLLQRVISFSNKIQASKQFSGTYDGDAPTQDEERYEKTSRKNEDDDRIREDRSFKNTVKKYESTEKNRTGNTVSVRHIDGSMRASIRNNKTQWLKDSDQEPNECRILSNARCLSEGVDVPALDAVIFLQPRKSKTDVVQSVGRVMRKSPKKDYGYVILPVVIPSGMTFDQSIHDNKAWKTVWQVLNALRSHNPNFANEINRVNLDRGPGGYPPKIENVEIVWMGSHNRLASEDEMFGKLVTKMVEKVGDRTYFEENAKKLGEKASQIRDRIKTTYENGSHPQVVETVNSLCRGLVSVINDTINQTETINVLAQHHALAQVFDVLFPVEFRSANPVASALDEAIGKIGMRGELEEFEEFYGEVKREAGKFQNTGGKQEYIRKIYGNFLMGFDKKKQESEGVVYTPEEVISFIIHSVEDVLRDEFSGANFNDRNVNVFDPFTGTGSFVTSLLESGLIKEENIKTKYSNDIWANEINLLAYYVASVNIESVFEKVSGSKKHIPFRNINYTDTLNHNPRYRLDSRHRQTTAKLDGSIRKMHENVERENFSHIHVIIGNPPYSAGQSNYNDQNQNVVYPAIDDRIKTTYLRRLKEINPKFGNVNSLYDSYIRSIRWASDRIGESGIIGFVTNASFIRSDAAAGLRACLNEEFTDVWVFDLRGNQRTQGEISKREGGKIFGSGSRAPVSITILVKNPNKKEHAIHYCDIGDYHSREKKLEIVRDFESINGIKDWQIIEPDKHHDWLDHRSSEFTKYLPIGSRNKTQQTLFKQYWIGVATSRDAWAYNSSRNELSINMKRHINYCDSQDPDNPVMDSKQAKWSPGLSDRLKNNKKKNLPNKFNKDKIRSAQYRPFFKQYLYLDSVYTHRPAIAWNAFLEKSSENMIICVTYKFTGEFSAIISDITPDIQLNFNGQCFPLRVYYDSDSRERSAQHDASRTLPSSSPTSTQESHQSSSRTSRPISKSSTTGSASRSTATTGRVVFGENITDFALQEYQNHYGDKKITKLDIFWYVYGLLHHSEYRKKYANNLSRELPHIPMAPDFWAFSKTGKNLACLHLSWETCKRHDLGTPKYAPKKFTKLSFGRTADKKNKTDKSVLRADGNVIFENIPETKYRVNGRTPVEWAVDRYKTTTDRDSGITNDATANVDLIPLIERLVHVGLESDRLVSLLPKEFEPKNWEPRKTGMDEFV